MTGVRCWGSCPSALTVVVYLCRPAQVTEAESLLANTTALVVQQLQLPARSCAVITNGRVLWVVDPRDPDNPPPGATCTHAYVLHLRWRCSQTWVVPPVHSARTVSSCGGYHLLVEDAAPHCLRAQ